MDYGADVFYHELAEKALEGWDRWNRDWPRPLYHETGFLVLAPEPMAPDGFEHDSHQLLVERGFEPVRLAECAASLGQGPWNLEGYPDGYLSTRAGWVESGEVISQLFEMAKGAGVAFVDGTVRGLSGHGSRVTGVVLDSGNRLGADVVVLAAGAWTPELVPELRNLLVSTAQPVLYFRPEQPERFRGEHFPAWAADTSGSGWYGFPALDDGAVKVGHHGKGLMMDPDARLPVGRKHEARTREFLSGFLPELATAAVVERRTCMYCDSADGDFLIAFDPAREGLVVATGGSGHGFKFAPLLGELVADAVGGSEVGRFGWRTEGGSRREASRSEA